MKYTLDKSQVSTVKQVAAMMAQVIKNETGADVEVTITPDSVLVYTEELTKIDDIKAIIGQARQFLSVSEYEADDDFPAGATLKFAL